MLILVSPFFLLVAVLIALDSKGGVFYKQTRVGKDERLFRLYKFRTMRPNADQISQITVGDRDPRVTRLGYYLRKYKLDEIPQLINILRGDMSVVGPRPEVPRYVALYTQEQRSVLRVKPGLTDYASIQYVNESEVLAQADDPEKTYIEKVLPHKLKLNQKYLKEMGFFTDIRIIFQTLLRIIR